MDSAKNWEDRYSLNQTGWDLNGPTPALQAAAEGLAKDAFLLIPGCGFGWDGEALWSKGYRNVYLSDWAPSAKTAFLQRVPDFPEAQFVSGDFFEWASQPELASRFDAVLECTFYCAIPPRDGTTTQPPWPSFSSPAGASWGYYSPSLDRSRASFWRISGRIRGTLQRTLPVGRTRPDELEHPTARRQRGLFLR